MSTLKLKQTTLAYTDQGNGPLVVLVHGSASSRQQWRKRAERLAGCYRVLAPDNRLIEISGAGHMSPVTHGGQVNVLIEAHLDRHTNLSSVQSSRKGVLHDAA